MPKPSKIIIITIGKYKVQGILDLQGTKALPKFFRKVKYVLVIVYIMNDLPASENKLKSEGLCFQ